MVKNHLKSIAAPKSWVLKRKKETFVMKPNPGAHALQQGMTLKFVFVELLGLVKTTKEMNYALNTQEILVDGKRRKDPHFCVGLLDVISVPSVKKQYRITLTPLGKLTAVEIPETEANLKPARIVGKRLMKRKTQLLLGGGRTLLIDKDDYKVNDSLLLEMPTQNIKEHYPLEKGATAFITGGKYGGHSGVIQSIDGKGIAVKIGDKEVIKTARKYAVVVGKLVTL